MLAGYVTYDELLLITGFSNAFLSKLIVQGLTLHQADLQYIQLTELQEANSRKCSQVYKQTLFNLAEVEEWLRMHVF